MALEYNKNWLVHLQLQLHVVRVVRRSKFQFNDDILADAPLHRQDSIFLFPSWWYLDSRCTI